MELPETSVLNLVVERYAEVLSELRLSSKEQPLVLPNSEWFPDPFQKDQASFERLVARMQGYAGLESVELEARLSGEEVAESCGTGGCGTGACGPSKAPLEAPRLVQGPSGWLLEMPAAAVHHPIALTAHVARLLGHVRLVEAGDTRADPARAELAATALGFGVLLLEASYQYSKSCGGPSVGSSTVLSCGELALPFALFVAMEGHKLRSALSELATTQRALVDEAAVLVASNAKLVERLRTSPERVRAGKFELSESRSWLSRLFSSKTASEPKDRERLALDALERGDSLDRVEALLGAEPELRASKAVSPRSDRRMRADDDVSSLVDEALSELRGNESRPPQTSAE